MSLTFFLCWGAVLVFDGILMATLTRMANSKKYGRYRIRTPQNYELPRVRKIVNTQLNNTLSLAIFAAFFYYLGPSELYAGWPGFTRLLGEVLGVLLLYDFMYYFFHRWMHFPKVMRHIHGVHHFVRFPTSDESIYLHPGETLIGVGLLVLSVTLIGPISTWSFVVMFLIYSAVNIIVHSNLVFPHPAFRLFNFWTTSHDVHHHKVRHNYASIFPFWDQLFGTYRTGPL